MYIRLQIEKKRELYLYDNKTSYQLNIPLEKSVKRINPELANRNAQYTKTVKGF